MNLLLPLSTFALIFLLICCILSDAYSSLKVVNKETFWNEYIK